MKPALPTSRIGLFLLTASVASAVSLIAPPVAHADRCDRIIEAWQQLSNPLLQCGFPYPCTCDYTTAINGPFKIGSWSCEDGKPCGSTLGTPFSRYGGNDDWAASGCSNATVNTVTIFSNCDEGPTATKAYPGDQCGVVPAPADDPRKWIGDPVDLTSGYLRQRATDIDLGGGLAFTRFFANEHSVLIDDDPEDSNPPTTTGPLGARWVHSLQWSLYRKSITAGSQALPAEIYTVARPLGHPRAFYKLDSESSFHARAGTGSLVEAGSQVIFTDLDGTKAVFDSSLQLVELTFPGQAPIAVTYGTNTSTFTRGAASLVVTLYGSSEAWPGKVKTVSGGGETVTYDYANLTYSVYTDIVLDEVVAPDRSTASTSDTVTWTYQYQADGGPVLARGGLLNKVKRNGTAVNSWGWASAANDYRVHSVDEPALDQALSLSFTTESGGVRKTTVRDTTTSANVLADVRSVGARVFEIDGAGGPGFEPAFETATVHPVPGYSAGKNEWRTLVDAEGRTTLYENYARERAPGRIVEGWVDATSGGGVGVFSSNDTYARLREFTWHPHLERPLTITEPSTLTGALEHVVTFDYDDPSASGDTSTPNEAPTDRVYRRLEAGKTIDGAGDVVAATTAVVTYAYDSLGRMTSVSGPRTENKTVFGYDGNGTGGTTGFRNSVKRCLNTGCTSYLETTYSNFDARGNAGTVTDPNGRVTTFTHDGLGRVRSVTPPWSGSGSSTVSFTYDADENLSKIDFPTDSFGSASSLTMGYTPKRRLEYMVDAQGNALVFEYDRSRVSRAARYTGFTSMTSRGTLRGDSKMTHDVAGRLVKSFNPLYTDDSVFTHVTGRDGVGNPTDVLDENAREDEFTFDSLDRLLELAEIRSSTYETDFAYDSQSNVTSITDPGTKETDYRNDDFGRLVEVTSPDTGVTRYLYDAAGDMISKIEDAEGSATRTTTYAYDPLNRLLEVDLPNDPDWDFTYDTDASKNQKGRLASVTNGVVTTAFEYTDRGQVKKETTTVGGLVYSVLSTWDKSGKLEAVTSPSGVVTTAKYRGLRPRELRVAAGAVDHTIEELEFLPFGPRSSAKIPPRDTGTGHNRVTSTRLYNERMQPKEIEVKDSGTLVVLDRRYAYDYRGGSPGPVEKGPNLDELIDDRDGSESRFYFYDELDRL